MAKYDGSVIFDTKIDRKGFEKGVDKLKSAGVKSMKLITGAVAATGTALVGLGGMALKSSIEFETAFAGVAKVLDATANTSLQDLNDGIRDLSKRLPQTASEIAGVAEAAGQLGIGADDVLDFTETMIMLGDTTNLSSEQAATAFARISAVTGMSTENFDNLASVVVAMGNNFATTESEVVEMGMRLAGTSAQVGLSEAHMFGLATAMSAVGINAEAGGSAMSRVMQKINSEVLSGGDNLEAFAKTSGLSADEFAKKWKEEPDQAIIAFVEGLGKIKESGGDVTTALKDMGLNSMQEVDTLLRLSGASDTLVDALDISAEAWDENTALLEEAKVFYNTTGAKMDMLKNNVDDLAISIGDGLKDSLLGVMDTGLGMIETLSAAFEEGGFPGLVEAIGTVIAEAVQLLADGAPQFLEMATNLISSFVTGIADNAFEIANSGVSIIEGLVGSITTLLPEILNLGMILLIEFVAGIAAALPDLMTMGMTMVFDLADLIIQQLPFIFDVGLDLLLSFIQGIMDNLPMLIEKVPQIINRFTGTLIEQLPKIIATGFKIIVSIITGLINAIPTLIANIPQIIMAIINTFMLINWATTGMNVIKGIGNGIKGFGGTVVSWTKGVGTNILNGIKSIFTGGASGIGKNLIRGIWNGISSMTDWILNLVKGFGSSVMKGIKGIFGIKSPSTVMRDQIGKNIALGLGEGIEDEVPSLQRDIDKQMQKITAGMQSTVDLETKGSGAVMTMGGDIANQAAQNSSRSTINAAQDNLAQERVLISGNNFEIREENDIEKVARQILTLTQRKERSGR